MSRVTVCKRDVAKDFRRLVNMSPREIRAWASDSRAKEASFESTRRRLPALARLKAKPVSRWTSIDCNFAQRVVSFNKRMRGMLKQHGCTRKTLVALRNWGHRASECTGLERGRFNR